MAEGSATADQQSAAPIVIEAALSPANAGDQRDQIWAAFEVAQSEKTTLAIGLDGESASPCAIQLLIATSRSARKHDVALEFSAEAQAALTGINLD